jgi:hypothetical protein
MLPAHLRQAVYPLPVIPTSESQSFRVRDYSELRSKKPEIPEVLSRLAR